MTVDCSTGDPFSLLPYCTSEIARTGDPSRMMICVPVPESEPRRMIDRGAWTFSGGSIIAEVQPGPFLTARHHRGHGRLGGPRRWPGVWRAMSSREVTSGLPVARLGAAVTSATTVGVVARIRSQRSCGITSGRLEEALPGLTGTSHSRCRGSSLPEDGCLVSTTCRPRPAAGAQVVARRGRAGPLRPRASGCPFPVHLTLAFTVTVAEMSSARASGR